MKRKWFAACLAGVLLLAGCGAGSSGSKGADNAPASSACGARRAVLGRKRLLLTPAAVCASPPGGYITAIAPILTKKPPIKTAA